MKRKSALLLIICLFFGAGLTQLSAQSENRTYQFWDVWDISGPIYCEGEVVDVLSLVVKVHLVIHYKNGEVVWRTDQIKGTGTGTSDTGEKFKYREIDTYISENEIYYRFNAKGDMGTHYMGTMFVDISGGWGNEVFTPLRTVCK